MEFKVLTADQVRNNDVFVKTEHAFGTEYIDETAPNFISFFDHDCCELKPREIEVHFIVALEDNKPVGVIKVKKMTNSMFHNKTDFWCFGYIGIRNDSKNKGIGKQLMHQYVKFLQERDVTWTSVTSFTKEGGKYVKPYLHSLLAENKIKFFQHP